MRILILTVGSRGDVQPYVALGAALRARGHAVTLCTGRGFEDMIDAHGLEAAPLSDNSRALVQTPEMQAALHSFSGKVRAWRAFKGMARRTLDEMWSVAQEDRPDVIVYHPKALGAPHIAEALGAVAVPSFLQPAFVPTGAFSSPLLPGVNLGRFGNRLSHQALLGLASIVTSRTISRWRRERLGLAPSGPRDLYAGFDPSGRPVPRLHGYSCHLVPKPDDWSEREHVTGYWFLDEGTDWEPPEALARFLDAGPPPVYVGFGSMPAKDPERMTGIVRAALNTVGARGLLATGWGGLDGAGYSDQIHVLDAAPHDWLFPRCAAVVHHGGAGTTHAALRWGRPAVICPVFGDQPFWGRCVAALGAGPDPLPQKRLTAAALAQALNAALSPVMQARADEVGGGYYSACLVNLPMFPMSCCRMVSFRPSVGVMRSTGSIS